LDKAGTLTFATCAGKYIAAHRTGWRSLKHAHQWENTLDWASYVFPDTTLSFL